MVPALTPALGQVPALSKAGQSLLIVSHLTLCIADTDFTKRMQAKSIICSTIL